MRFAVVALVAHVLIFLLSLFVHVGVLFFVAAFLIVAVALSAWRRAQDANVSQTKTAVPLVAAVGSPVLLALLGALDAAIWLQLLFLVVGLSLSGLLAILPASTPRQYVLGYDGPANENVPKKANNRAPRERVEPIIAQGESSHVGHPVDENASSKYTEPSILNESVQMPSEAECNAASQRQYDSRQANATPVWLQQVLLHQNKLAAGCVGLLLIATTIGLWPQHAQPLDSAQLEASTEQQSLHLETKQQRAVTAQAKLPDGLGLQLQGRVLVLHWLGEEGAASQLWDLASAEGDKSCAYAEFNNGSRYRPLDVALTEQGTTEARFSPLDTQAVVKDVALRGNLRICGYRFSLKGSQAALAKVDDFAALIQ
ncbi:hypothetical protein GCM10009332_20060 [Shewanella gelidii]|uniref:Uncharacterized protein n=1 Tax=Shewanella gelidii TaxID=1642821 RepID=A0A917NAW7_9GAMM|nr:hypothetical protein GCM10009332_20060 [Shewanella gelidii]